MNKESPHTQTLETSKDYYSVLEHGSVMGITISARIANPQKEDAQEACSTFAKFARNFYMQIGNEMGNVENMAKSDSPQNERFVLSLEIDDEKQELTCILPGNDRKLLLNKMEACFLADALTRQIGEWDCTEAASPKGTLEKFLIEIAGLVFPDESAQLSNEDIEQSRKVRLCILVGEPAECLFGISIPSVGADFDKLHAAIDKYKATVE